MMAPGTKEYPLKALADNNMQQKNNINKKERLMNASIYNVNTLFLKR